LHSCREEDTEAVRKQKPRHTMWYNAGHSPKMLIYAAFLIVPTTLSITLPSSVTASIRGLKRMFQRKQMP